MSFPPYAEYKDSGVAWLGAVPGHWEHYPLFALVAELDNKNTGMQEENLLSLSYGQIKRKNIDDNDGLLPASFETYQIVEKDDLVWRLTDLQNDQRSLRTGLVRERGIITSAYLATRPKGIHAEFLAYLMRAYDITKVFYSMGGGLRQSMKFSDVKWLPILLPPRAEQEAIAGFLDREVGKIDGLVAEQERLIALLKEKRQAVISHAVTKGLNPNAPLKDSGIEWLGQIPEHWEVKPLKYGISFIESGVSVNAIDVPASDDEIGVLKTSAVYTGRFRPEENKAVIAEERVRASCPVKAGCLIVSRMNTPDLVGATGLVIEDAPNLFLPDRLWQVHFSELEPAFTHLWTQSPFYRSQVQVACAGTSSSMQNLSLDEFKSFLCPFPPTDEQAQIAVRVVEVMSGYEKLMTEAQSAITLLQERRAALISAAVTGKIDVRAAALDSTAELETA